MTTHSDTIVAVSTPPGPGGIGIVRLSGPQSAAICSQIAGKLPKQRVTALCDIHALDGKVIDHAIVIHFPGPRSYSGEDMVEIQAHGSPVILDQIVEHATRLGARIARPGEFTERAFLNGRLDLTQAEAVADLVESRTRVSARAALRTLDGALSRKIHPLNETLTGIRVFVEAAIDFPEEEIDFLSESDVLSRVDALLDDIDALLAECRRGAALRRGVTIALAGAPNAGKSSLLNRLAGHDRAIVSDIPGTTRDLVEQAVDLDGLPLVLVDMAGIRESDDPVEKEGVRRALDAIGKADLCLLIVDDSKNPDEQRQGFDYAPPGDLETVVIHNKIDVSGRPPGPFNDGEQTAYAISALRGDGMEALITAIRGHAGIAATEPEFIARRRHLDAISDARSHVVQGRSRLIEGDGDLCAEDLRLAHVALGRITGETTSDDLLGEIFSSFCIGK